MICPVSDLLFKCGPNFRFIRQNGDFCLLASIENVFKYHNENVDQYEIAAIWRRNHTIQSISIPGIARTLKRSRFKNNFEVIVGGRVGSTFNPDFGFADEQALIDYIESCCDDGNPLIICVGPRNNPPAHMLVVLGYDSNGIIMFFDPNNKCHFPLSICFAHKRQLINNPPFKQDLPTLLIKPR